MSFAPAVAEAVAVAYKGAPHEVQQRIRRVVDVWRERGVFEGPIQQAVEARIQGEWCRKPVPLRHHVIDIEQISTRLVVLLRRPDLAVPSSARLLRFQRN